jgi:hypothetical protein
MLEGIHDCKGVVESGFIAFLSQFRRDTRPPASSITLLLCSKTFADSFNATNTLFESPGYLFSPNPWVVVDVAWPRHARDMLRL